MSKREQTEIEKALAAPFDARELKFKPQMVKNNRCLAMAYISARVVMDRLDEVLGVDGWEDQYTFLPNGSVLCVLTCEIDGKEVCKSDVGSESEQPDIGDKTKAAVSDALKRAAVKFGVGRYIYRLPAQWVDYDPVKKQIVQPPQLPDWALPGKQVDRQKPTPPKNPMPNQVATAAKDEPKGQMVEDNLEIQRLNVMLSSGPGIDDVNQFLKKLPGMTEYCKAECWTKLCVHAKYNGWTFNDATKKFEPPKARANANSSL